MNVDNVTMDNIREVLDEHFNEMVQAAHAAAEPEMMHEWDKRALDWPLTNDSVVVEVGGYIGRWSLQIAQKFNPRLYVFEPQGWAYEVCVEVLKSYPNAHVFNYALGTMNTTMTMGNYGTDGCSFVDNTTGKTAPEHMQEIGTVVRSLGLTNIDLMLINVEGYEYKLLLRMLQTKLLPDRLMVQFHTMFDETGVMLQALTEQLAEYYEMVWDYGVVLKAWQRKGLN